MEASVWLISIMVVFFMACGMLRVQKRNAFYLFVINAVHFIFAWAFLVFSDGEANDSFNYYFWATLGLDLGYTGTGFIVSIVKFLLWIGITDYFYVFLFFSSLSSLGLLAIFNYLLNRNRDGSRYLDILLFFCFLLPGLHFWTVSVGKDSLSIILIALLLIASLEHRYKTIILLLVALFFVRSHIALLIGGSIGLFLFLYYKFNNLSNGIVRLGLMILSLPVSALVISFLMGAIQKYSATGFDSFGDFVANRQEVYAGTDAGAILVGQPYFVKVFAQIFGAIPWLSLNVLSIFSLLEGLIIFTLFAYAIYRFIILKNKNSKYVRLGVLWFIFVVAFILLMPIISTNLGIMVRMRVMIYLPIFVILFCLIRDRYLLRRKIYV